MPTKTAILKTRVPAEVKNQVLEVAKKNAKTESEFLRSLIFAAIALDVDKENNRQIESSQQTKKLSLRLSEALLESAKLKANSLGLSVNKWIDGLIQTAITGRAIFSTSEVMALKESNRHLSAIGNNLNQIARGINAEIIHSVDAGLLKDLLLKINENRSEVIALTKLKR